MVACYRPNNRGSGCQAESSEIKMSSENYVISFEPPQSAYKRDQVTSKASKVRPKVLFGGLQEPQEGRNKHPKEAQEAPKDSPREPKST